MLNSDDPDAERIYLEHIKRRTGAHYPLGTYLPAAKALFRSMQAKGFSECHPIPVNKNNMILGGAHRTACASVLGLKAYIYKHDTGFTWPAWGREWFLENGMADELPWMEEALTEILDGNE